MQGLNDIQLNYKTKEALKTLRTNIEFSGSDKKVIVLTSCVPHEGKSTIAVQLANTIAESNKKVLLIDADMRASVLVGRYKIKGAVEGLSSFLSGHCGVDEVITKTNKENMQAILAGVVPPNPAELLNGKRFETLIKAVREIYDYIIIDAPPLLSVIDAAIIAKNCDGLILVISQGTVSRKAAIEVKKQIETTGCPILGVVLNKVDMSSKRYGSYGSYYGDYYGDYYGKSSKETSKEEGK